MIEAQLVFEIWAPSFGAWSDWAKPTLFVLGTPGTTVTKVFPPGGLGAMARPALHAVSPWMDLVSSAGETAVVLDLPDTVSVLVGMALARRGFRPVPMYNGCSGPQGAGVISNEALCIAMAEHTQELLDLKLPGNAPPVFMLDSRRRGYDAKLEPGKYDNRWVVFAQDFPSASALSMRGIKTVVVVRNVLGVELESDLKHVLWGWSKGGLKLVEVNTEQKKILSLDVKPPWFFRSMWYRLAQYLMHRRQDSAGGFGGRIPVPGEGGSGRWG